MALGEGSLGSHLLRGALLPRIQTVVGADGDGSVALLPLESRIWSRCSLRVVRRSAASSGGRASRCARVSTGFPPPVSKGSRQENMGQLRKKRSTADVSRFRDNTGGVWSRKSWRSRSPPPAPPSALRRSGPIEAIRSARATCVRTFGACEVPNCSNRAGPRSPRHGHQKVNALVT